MFDIDYAPAVFGTIIAFVVLLPAIYGMFFVDAHWKAHKENAAEGGDDVFN